MEYIVGNSFGLVKFDNFCEAEKVYHSLNGKKYLMSKSLLHGEKILMNTYGW